MRKLSFILAALILMLLSCAALAEAGEPAAEASEPVDITAIDLSQATLEELRALRERVNQRITELETNDNRLYESGTYAVGIDIPAGIYLVLEEEHSIFPSITLRRGATADSQLISYEMIINQAVIQLTAGTFFTITDAVAYPFDRAPDSGLQDGIGEEGGYWVGVQIPAGRYRIVPDDKAPLSNFSIYSGVLGTGAQTLRFELIYDPLEVDLETGQYIVLSGCSLYSE